jgi:transmembrane sensor
MKEKRKDIVIPPGLRDSLRDEPDEKRRRIEQIWNLLGEFRPPDEVEVSTDEAWSDLVNHLEPSSSEATLHQLSDRCPHLKDGRLQRVDRRPRRNRRVVVGVAIAAAAVAVFGIWFIQPITISVEPGRHAEVILPDGSVVEINSATELRYARGFAVPVWSRAERRVIISGEAFFRVEPSRRPFVVETSDARIEAVGTTFNVRSRPGAMEGGTQVTLKSGRIRLYAMSDPDGAVILSDPGAGGLVSAAGRIHTSTAESAAPLEHVLAWRDRGFATVDRPLGAVLDEVERRYGVTIAPRMGVDPIERMSLFYPRGGTVDQILRDVCLIQGCTYRETSRGFALSAPDTSL